MSLKIPVLVRSLHYASEVLHSLRNVDMPIPIQCRRNKNKKITSSTHLDKFDLDDLECDLTSEGASTSDSGGLDGSTTITTMQAAPAVTLPTTAMPTSTDLVTPAPVMSSATTATTIVSATMATAPPVADISTSLDTGTELIMQTWSDLDRLLGYTQEPYSADNPSQCPLGTDFQSMDPNFMDLDLSCIDYSDSSFVPFDAGSNNLPDIQWEAWNSALNPLSEEEMLYYPLMFNHPDKQEGREGGRGGDSGQSHLPGSFSNGCRQYKHSERRLYCCP